MIISPNNRITRVGKKTKQKTLTNCQNVVSFCKKKRGKKNQKDVTYFLLFDSSEDYHICSGFFYFFHFPHALLVLPYSYQALYSEAAFETGMVQKILTFIRAYPYRDLTIRQNANAGHREGHNAGAHCRR